MKEHRWLFLDLRQRSVLYIEFEFKGRSSPAAENLGGFAGNIAHPCRKFRRILGKMIFRAVRTWFVLFWTVSAVDIAVVLNCVSLRVLRIIVIYNRHPRKCVS